MAQARALEVDDGADLLGGGGGFLVHEQAVFAEFSWAEV
jgi:hypothetical protein